MSHTKITGQGLSDRRITKNISQRITTTLGEGRCLYTLPQAPHTTTHTLYGTIRTARGENSCRTVDESRMRVLLTAREGRNPVCGRTVVS
ncbi:hypothetical protein Hamer_G021545 [Homarus americanus]|uniref:Uncharacterized protein n=1 Tax=Homarus americanus TaxID=6706 RepID=A0A8J5N6F9_HOMAM|nr:hypothetical protein Hamer_G021545 [Homarus americanus]